MSGRKFEVFLDGHKLGDIRNGEKQRLDIAAGQHSMFIIKGKESNTIEIDLGPNSSANYECGILSRYFIFSTIFSLLQGGTFVVLLLLALLSKNDWYVWIGCPTMIIISLLVDKFFSKPGKAYYLKDAPSG